MTRGKWNSAPARHFAAALAASTMLIGVAAVAPAFAQGADTVVIARDMDIDSLDPARAFCDTCQIYLSSAYDRLVDLDKDNQTIVPLLAEKWESQRRPDRVHLPSRPGRDVLGRLAGRGQGREMVVGAPEEHEGRRRPS